MRRIPAGRQRAFPSLGVLLAFLLVATGGSAWAALVGAPREERRCLGRWREEQSAKADERTAALDLRLGERPADAKALAGGRTFGEDADERGAPVLAAMRSLRAAPWGLVVRIDREEALRPYRRWLVTTSVVLAALLVGLSGVAYGHRHRLRSALRTASSRETRRLAELVNHANDAILVVSADGRVVQGNERAVQMYGTSHRELAGLTFEDLGAPEAQGGARAAFDRAVRRGGSAFETVHRRRDGTTFPVEVSVTDGGVDGERLLLAVVRDITERTAGGDLRTALFEISEAPHRSATLAEMFASIHQIVGRLMDARNLYVALQDAETGVISFPYFEDEHDVPPEPEQAGRGLTAYVLRTGKPLLATPEVLDALVLRGEVEAIGAPSIDWLGVPLAIGDRTIGALAVQTYAEGSRYGEREREILTFVSRQVALAIERKRSEDALRASERLERARALELRAILDAVPAAVRVTRDAAGRRIVNNALANRWIGAVETSPAAPGSEAPSPETFRALKDGVEIPPAELPLRRAARGEEVRDNELDIVAPDGTLRHILGNAVPLRDELGNVTGAVSAFVDITERNRAIAALREREFWLHESQRVARLGSYVLDVVTGQWTGSPMLDEILGIDERHPHSVEGWGEIVHPEDRAEMRTYVRDLVATRGRFEREYRIVRVSDGAVRWVAGFGELSFAPDGAPATLVGTIQDITERKHAELALREREASLAQSQRVAHVGHWSWDTRSNRVEWSDEMKRIFGLDPETFAGDLDTIIEQAIHPEDREKLLAANQAVLTRQAPAPLEYRVVLPDQSVRTVRAVPGDTTVDARGQIVRLTGIVQDITVQRRAEAALHESEARYRSLFERSPIGIYRTTPKGEILDANPALLAMLGYASLAELQARNLEEVGFEPDCRRSEFKEVIERDGFVRGLQAKWLRRDGTELVVNENAQAIRAADGTVMCYEGAVEDVTHRTLAEAALRASEERYRQVFERAPIGVFHYDPGLRITDCNEQFAAILGSSLDRLIGLDMHHLKDTRALPALAAAIAGKDGEYVGPYEATTSSAKRIGALRTAPLRGKDGEITGGVGTIEDITERRRLEDQLRHAQRVEAVGQLAGGIAHDFNNLLQAVTSQLAVLKLRLRGTVGTQRELEEVEQLVRRGGMLTRQLLLFARHQAASREFVDLNRAVEASSTLLRRVVRENVAIVTDLAAEPLPVLADRGQLDQVLMNLAVNASDAMPGGGRLTLATGGDSANVWLRVSDTGFGIPEDALDHVFEPFFTTKGVGKGTGLGLSVVHGIVNAHGGAIDVTSAAGKGATFTVVLPRHLAAARPESQAGDEAIEMPGGRGERVLLVEDEDGARRGLLEILGSLGYAVTATASGEEARALPIDPGYDLLLTDLMLPGITGTDLAASLTARWPDLRVVLMSGYARDEMLQRLGPQVHAVFLQKPFDMATLARELRAALDDRAT